MACGFKRRQYLWSIYWGGPRGDARQEAYVKVSVKFQDWAERLGIPVRQK